MRSTAFRSTESGFRESLLPVVPDTFVRWGNTALRKCLMAFSSSSYQLMKCRSTQTSLILNHTNPTLYQSSSPLCLPCIAACLCLNASASPPAMLPLLSLAPPLSTELTPLPLYPLSLAESGAGAGLRPAGRLAGGAGGLALPLAGRAGGAGGGGGGAGLCCTSSR